LGERDPVTGTRQSYFVFKNKLGMADVSFKNNIGTADVVFSNQIRHGKCSKKKGKK
jgi:hypothetical protein